MKINKVKKIVIVGGGTSAWLAAASISNRKPFYEIIVIDKEDGAPIGVGEGTILGFVQVMEDCGLSPKDWFFEVDATFKGGILFPGWSKNEKLVWHPFMFPKHDQFGTSSLDAWTHDQQDIKYNGLSMFDITVRHNKIDMKALELGNYAYHLDCGKLVKLLQNKILGSRNVNLIKSEVVLVERDNDNITKLFLKNGEEISADLYIDCTGFKNVLRENPDKVNLEGRLFCDTAVAGRVEYNDRKEEMQPYIVSEAVEHGWIWTIPIQTRMGTGLVFNRNITDIDEAKDYLVNYWEGRLKKENIRVIDWTPYYLKDIWKGNCVSIGLSAGFIEPLESTGIALIATGIEQIIYRLGTDYYSDVDILVYNNILTGYYEDSIDFINMHYDNVDQESKFWNWVKETRIKSDRQKFFENSMASNEPLLPVGGQGFVFDGVNWICWLTQLGYPVSSKSGVPKEVVEKHIFDHRSTELNRHVEGRDHYDYVEELKKYYLGETNNG